MTSSSPGDPEMDEALKLMIRLFEGDIDSKSASLLDALVCRRADIRRLYVRLAHQYCALLPVVAALHSKSLDLMPEPVTEETEAIDDLQHPAAAAAQSLNETMILPALREVDAAGDEQDESCIFQPAPYRPDPQNPLRTASRWWYRTAIVVALTVLGIIMVIVSRQHQSSHPSAITKAPPPAPEVAPEPAFATITATAGVGGDGADMISPRTDITPGRPLRLSAGAIEVTFATGATVLVRAPAQIRVEDRNTLAVDSGSVYAHVPPQAVGFRITAPGLGVVDRGTNFGVRTAHGGTASEVHVFDGRVDATALDSGGQTSGPVHPLTAGQAVAHSALSASSNVQTIPFQANAFDRDINRIRIVVASHGTGENIDSGKPDPAWQLIAVPNDPAWQPRPAIVVLDPRPEYVPNSPKAKWISTSAHMDYVAGGDYVYRTSIDLTGFDPASISVVANFAVDDNIREIRVNGQASSLPNELTLGLDRTMARTTLHQLSLSNVRWLSGPNQVDVVVWNLTGDPNFTGLQLSWSISASPIVMR